MSTSERGVDRNQNTVAHMYTLKNQVGFPYKRRNSLSNEMRERYLFEDLLAEKREPRLFCIKGGRMQKKLSFFFFLPFISKIEMFRLFHWTQKIFPRR